ncbi:Inositol phosphoceramide mannosyltransferase 1 [Colletotrichum tanaceti]|uniref:Inositol phosphoceramide mannosyltransferase 1 n=1 Tax=Colletotrichum tanaceti TaxID=1306861 RepID=A0A4U6X2X2_9PEZI|nr:Inositol phosphoceramide mannosyltransferase 1 [Colletotrichum tanaceti]TKW49728.1 Inositol phosphoceramide mannosyltransferase 1 [Colletotrichum tanaceti]
MMITLPGKVVLRISAVMTVTLMVALVVHQISYTSDFTLPNRSIHVISVCDDSEQRKWGDLGEPLESSIPREPIPKIVHQIWKNSDVGTYPVQASSETWEKSLAPLNYTVKLWTDDDVLKLIKANYAWLLSTYEGYSQNIQRADVARLVVVHAEGGTYADLDVFPRSTKEMACLQGLGLEAIFAATSGNLGASNHFFMAQRRSPFLEWALQEAKRRGGSTPKRILLPYLRVFWSTGPIMVTHAFRRYAWMYDGGPALLDEGYASRVFGHAAGRSWHGSDGRFLNYVSDHLGVLLFWTAATLSVAALSVVLFIKRCRGKSIELIPGCGPRLRSKERYIEV